MSASHTTPEDSTIIARVPKNSFEEVVIRLVTSRDIRHVDGRIYADHSGADDERRPTRKGIALKIERLPELIVALRDAEAEARRRGSLAGGSDRKGRLEPPRARTGR